LLPGRLAPGDRSGKYLQNRPLSSGQDAAAKDEPEKPVKRRALKRVGAIVMLGDPFLTKT
jgi:hypothetical protein